jgi:hypothetical protein
MWAELANFGLFFRRPWKFTTLLPFREDCRQFKPTTFLLAAIFGCEQ